ncbi:unnamed protein product [Brassica oleracea var. botrytis]|uniref:USP domain-containing protein n=2 Tax=Brassica oleracea TaxID=3712 RepID=A0A0D3A243_BRAOL|nr:unnamed protein product [Brassica oleracea]
MPCDFVKRLRFWRGNFEEDREEDAHEFLIQLIYACPSEDILVVLRTNTINVQHVNVNLIMSKHTGGSNGKKNFEKELVCFECQRGLSELDQPKYMLCGFVEHIGSDFKTGHYTAYVQNSGPGKWYCVNDSNVSDCRLEDVLKRNSYIMFFKCSNERPAQIRSKITSQLHDSSSKSSIEKGRERKEIEERHPAFSGKLPTFWAVKTNIQVSGELTTSCGPDPSFQFALSLANQLFGETTAKSLEELLLLRDGYQNPKTEEFNSIDWSLNHTPREKRTAEYLSDTEGPANDQMIQGAEVVIDGNVITSLGLATVTNFSLAIVSKLFGHGRAISVSEGLVHEYRGNLKAS